MKLSKLTKPELEEIFRNAKLHKTKCPAPGQIHKHRTFVLDKQIIP